MTHDDLVAYALGNADGEQAQRILDELSARDRAELERIQSHLALHDHVPELQPAPPLWNAIRAELETGHARPSLLRRFWLTGAAAALVAAAFFVPQDDPPVRVTRLFGRLAPAGGNTWTSEGVCRMRLGTGVTVTMDDDTTITALSDERLALKAGRVFLEVDKTRRGFTIEADGLTVVTTGTAFLVESNRVLVESGSVRCTYRGRTADIGAGEEFTTGPAAPLPSPRSWFQTPRITATLLTPDTVRIVLGNDMPDLIQLAPPTGGEPLFFASYGGHDYPLSPPGFDGTLMLMPGARLALDVPLPRPVPDGETLLLSHPATGLRTEATRK